MSCNKTVWKQCVWIWLPISFFDQNWIWNFNLKITEQSYDVEIAFDRAGLVGKKKNWIRIVFGFGTIIGRLRLLFIVYRSISHIETRNYFVSFVEFDLAKLLKKITLLHYLLMKFRFNEWITYAMWVNTSPYRGRVIYSIKLFFISPLFLRGRDDIVR